MNAPSRFLSPRHSRWIAAALVAAAASSLSLGAMAAPGWQGRHDGGSSMLGGRGIERMLDGVDASAEQRTQINGILQAARTDLKAQHQGGRALHEQLQKLLTAPNVDDRAVEAVRQQMLAQHDQRSRRMMQALVDASRVLTPAQRQKIAEHMNQRRAMMERHRAERESLGTPAK
jgi:Spy/CpxP family protein refolding chaperone